MARTVDTSLAAISASLKVDVQNRPIDPVDTTRAEVVTLEAFSIGRTAGRAWAVAAITARSTSFSVPSILVTWLHTLASSPYLPAWPYPHSVYSCGMGHRRLHRPAATSLPHRGDWRLWLSSSVGVDPVYSLAASVGGCSAAGYPAASLEASVGGDYRDDFALHRMDWDYGIAAIRS